MDSEAIRHFELIQATVDAGKETSSAAVLFPKDWAALVGLLNRLAYAVDVEDPWTTLGFGPLNGPEVTELDIASRARTARILCPLAQDVAWPDG